MALEEPTYELLKTFPGFELRNYDRYFIAAYKVKNINQLRDASSIAFGRLFSYISGSNDAAQKISMTVPVQQEPVENGWRVSFVVPRDVAAKGTPKPADAGIEIVPVEAGLFAVRRYRGIWNSQRFQDEAKDLMAALSDAGYRPIGEVSSAVYNPPLTPPFLRRNEVMVRVTAV